MSRLLMEMEQKRSIKISLFSHIRNHSYNILHSGEPAKWVEAGFYVRLPKSSGPEWSMTITILNSHLHVMFVGELVVVKRYSA